MSKSERSENDESVLQHQGRASGLDESLPMDGFSDPEASKLFQVLAEHSMAGVYIIQDGKFRYVNPAFADSLGRPRQEIIGARVPGDLVLAEDRHKVAEFIRRRIDGEVESVRYSFRAAREDGKVILCEALGRVVELDGSPAIIGTALDVTDREHARDALIESEAMFRSLAEKSPNMIFINQGGKVVYANQICEEITGYSREALTDPEFDFMQLIAPESADLIRENFRAHMSGRELSPYDYRLITKEGEQLDAIIATRLIRYEGDIAILGIVMDVTERKEAERELARLLEVESRHRRLAESLARVGLSMTANLELRELLDLICLESMNLFEVGAAFVWLREGDELLGFAGHGQGRDDFLGRRLALDDTDSLASRIVHEAVARYVNHAESSDELNQEMVRLFGVKALLGIPLVSGSQSIGALMILDSEDPDRFDENDLEAARVLGSQLALAVESAQLIERDRHRLEQLAELHSVSLDVAASLNLSKVLDIILEAVLKLAGASNAHIYLYDQESQRLGEGRALHDSGDRTPAVEKPRVNGLTGTVAKTGEPLIIDDAPSHELFADLEARKWNLRSIAGFPLKVGTRVVGVLTVAYQQAHTFVREETRLLELLGNEAAIAIENARLFGEAKQRLKDQNELIEAGAVISSTLELETILHRIAQQMGQAIDATSAYLCSYDQQSGTSKVLADHYGPRASAKERDSDLGFEYHLPTSFAGTAKLLEKRQPFVTHIEDDNLIAEERAHMEEYGARSTLVIPLEVGGQVIAYAELWETAQHRDFSEDEISLCQAIGQQAAIAMEHGRLYDQAQQEIAERARVEEALEGAVEQLEKALERQHQLTATEEALRDSLAASSSTLNVDEVLDSILSNVGRVVPHDTADIMLLLEGDDGRTYAAAVRGIGYAERGLDAWLESVRFPLNKNPVFGIMAETGKPRALPDVRNSPNWVDIEATRWIKSYAGAPIRIKGRNIGFLNLCSETPGFFNEEHAERLQVFADQAAVAIDNARLYAQSQQEVAERKRAEDTLRASEERLKIVFDRAPDAYFITDLRGNFLDVNRATENLNGYDRSELIGKSYLDLGLIPTSEIPRAAGLLTRSAIGKAGGPDEFTMICKDGSRITVAIRTYPVRIEGKMVILGMARDVTEQKRFTTEIQRLKEFSEGIIQTMAEGIVVTDTDGTMSFVNPATADLLGYREEELVGQQWTMVIPADLQDAVAKALQRRSTGESDRYEMEVVRKNGERMPILISGRPHYQNGEYVGSIAAFTDIGELKRATQALKASEESYRGIFEGIQDGILVESLTGAVLDANQQACEIYGWSRDELLSKTVSDLVPEDALAIVPGEIMEIPEGPVETVNLRANGERFPVETTTRLHSIGGEDVVLVVVRDISERKRIEAAESEFRRMKEEFVLSASHSLRTPLHSLMGFLELLREGKVKEPYKQQEFLDQAGKQAQSIASLVEDLLDAVQLEAGQLELEIEPIALDDLVLEVIESLKSAAMEKGISLTLSSQDGRSKIAANRVRLAAALARLVENAIRASPEGGTVVIEVGMGEGEARIQVIDEGPGYSEADLELMLERPALDGGLHTEDLSITGLGLYLAKSIVEAHGGRLSAESETGKGSTFAIALPHTG